jgi:hypothetical protein
VLRFNQGIELVFMRQWRRHSASRDQPLTKGLVRPKSAELGEANLQGEEAGFQIAL